MTATIGDASFGTSRTIGRYFGIVSAVPTVVLAVYLILLIASGAWKHRPDFRAGVEALASVNVIKVFGLLAVTLAAALILHTVQFALVQFLEGYWGGNRLMRFLRTRRTLHHMARRRGASERLNDANEILENLSDANKETVAYVAACTDRADALNVIYTYPDGLEGIMPTRLGNLLRKYEDDAGRGYEINILQKATHLALVAPKNHVDYLNDQRNVLDLAVRLCVSGIIASLATVLLMWPWDVWLLLAAVPYFLAYVSYRGALVAAGHYGDALAALVDLNRFRMYEAFHLKLPDNTESERVQNGKMTEVVAGILEVSVSYEHPQGPSIVIVPAADAGTTADLDGRS